MSSLASVELPPDMKAQFLDAFESPYNLRTVPLPTLTSSFDLLIRVDAASYCHTDAVLAAGNMPPNPPSFPHVGCHEFAGTVVRLPDFSEVEKPHEFRVGDRVGVPGRAFHPCGTCFECRDTMSPNSDPAGYSVYCINATNHGITGPGGFREYAVVDSRQVAPIPDQLTAVETAPLMCAGLTIFAALKRCNLSPGQRIAIIGCGGGLGHLGLQFAVKMGLRVIGVDNADNSLSLASQLQTGAHIVDSRQETAEQLLSKISKEDGMTESGSFGVDAAIILPESQNAFDYGMNLVKNHGRCVIVSFPKNGFQLSTSALVFRDISVVGSLVGSNGTLREMLAFTVNHNIRTVIHRYPLSRLNDLVHEYHQNRGGKLVIDMSIDRNES